MTATISDRALVGAREPSSTRLSIAYRGSAMAGFL